MNDLWFSRLMWLIMASTNTTETPITPIKSKKKVIISWRTCTRKSKDVIYGHQLSSTAVSQYLLTWEVGLCQNLLLGTVWSKLCICRRLVIFGFTCTPLADRGTRVLPEIWDAYILFQADGVFPISQKFTATCLLTQCRELGGLRQGKTGDVFLSGIASVIK